MGLLSSIEAVFSRFSAIVQTLQWACAERNSSQAVEARGLLLQICDHSFISQLHIMRKIFNITLSLSNILQTKRLDLGKACMLVGATIEQLELMKDKKTFQKLNSEAKHFASQLLVMMMITTSLFQNASEECLSICKTV